MKPKTAYVVTRNFESGEGYLINEIQSTPEDSQRLAQINDDEIPGWAKANPRTGKIALVKVEFVEYV